ncbi:aspartate carbamoyltransferase [Paenibacillus nasutitermitis]|uniref:Aspartate carbamoyltransferase n=1 Tax=Paenibacillus nasutitermitis TaxID=1652958 RepID=A0A916YWY5_9BACL|nr:aspartate carbamoyltransferase [Paenibacillus nasutitermitis]GGD64544.1 aspartate carbamoyltransferase [Paenibacillus nasutitermitis]
MNPPFHVIGSKQFDQIALEQLFHSAAQMEQIVAAGGTTRFAGKIMCSLFFEASTRTRLSFESAMYRLGGSVIGTENAAQFSSAIKGETLEDTVRVVSGYCDVIVLRHTDVGAAHRAAEVSARVPVVNAGDGSGEHPTQALLDLYTIQKELGRIEGLHIAMIGDLTYGRTVHSLSYLLSNYKDIKITFIAPDNARIPEAVKRYLDEKGVVYEETGDLMKVSGTADVFYQTRVQKERFPSLEEYQLAAGKYIINRHLLDHMRSDALILHPLPRAGEIDAEVDADPRAGYFRQAQNGLFIRMAILENCLGAGSAR